MDIFSESRSTSQVHYLPPYNLSVSTVLSVLISTPTGKTGIALDLDLGLDLDLDLGLDLDPRPRP